MVLHIFKHEMRLIFRDPRFWIPFLVPPVILGASQGIAISHYGPEIMEGSEEYIMLLLGCLMAPMGAPLAADSFAGERERNSLELLQLSPIKPRDLFWGKLLAILPFPLIFLFFVQGGYWYSHPAISLSGGVSCVIGAFSAMLVVNTFALMVSLRVKTVRAASHITVFLLVPLLLFVQLFYQIFLSSLVYPIATFIFSLALSCFFIAASMKRFLSL